MHPWQPNGTFVAHLTTETPDGRKKLVWHVLTDAQSVSEARQAMAELEAQRGERHLHAQTFPESLKSAR